MIHKFNVAGSMSIIVPEEDLEIRLRDVVVSTGATTSLTHKEALEKLKIEINQNNPRRKSSGPVPPISQSQLMMVEYGIQTYRMLVCVMTLSARSTPQILYVQVIILPGLCVPDGPVSAGFFAPSE